MSIELLDPFDPFELLLLEDSEPLRSLMFEFALPLRVLRLGSGGLVGEPVRILITPAEDALVLLSLLCLGGLPLKLPLGPPLVPDS